MKNSLFLPIPSSSSCWLPFHFSCILGYRAPEPCGCWQISLAWWKRFPFSGSLLAVAKFISSSQGADSQVRSILTGSCWGQCCPCEWLSGWQSVQIQPWTLLQFPRRNNIFCPMKITIQLQMPPILSLVFDYSLLFHMSLISYESTEIQEYEATSKLSGALSTPHNYSF